MDPLSLNLIMIVAFVIGSGLIIVEAFIPGLGAAGVCGVILEIVALRCCWLRFGTVPTLLAMLGVFLLIGLAVFLSYRSALHGRLSKSHLILNQTETAAEAAGPEDRIGTEAVTVTALRPAGTIEAGGVRLNAASEGDFIEKGVPVLITGMEGGRCTVRRKA